LGLEAEAQKDMRHLDQKPRYYREGAVVASMEYTVKRMGLAPKGQPEWGQQALEAAEAALARIQPLVAARLHAPSPRWLMLAAVGWLAFEPRHNSHKRPLQRAGVARSWNRVFALKDTS
jgi:hypothetical protein